VAFDDSFLEEVRHAADIVRYVSDHVSLKKMGTSWKGLCPFHHEKTPSFNVNPDRGIFHCFGCGAGGDVFKFAMLQERVSFPESIEIVARRFGVQIPERRGDTGPDRKEREEMLALLEAASDHFQQNFWAPVGTKAREYLLGRGFRKDTLEKIKAGAAAESWSDLLDSLRKRFPVPLLMTAGLVLEGQSKRPYDRFRNRAVFPILNESGRVVGFGARSLDGSEPKYLNSPESPVYQKSRTLYGLSWARESIRRENRVVLMEGYLDVARAIEGGVTEAVATCGTALTGGHARLLRRFTETAVVNFDQDDAGQKAARKSLDFLLEEGLKVKVVQLPAGDDPDTFVKAQGGDAYRQRLDQAPDSIEWLIQTCAAENDTKTPAGKAAYLNAILPVLARLDSAVERTAWMPKIIERGGLDPMGVREELRRALSKGASTAPGALKEPPAEASPGRRAGDPARPGEHKRILPAEKLLLGLLVSGKEGLSEALAQLSDGDLDTLRSAAILRHAREIAESGPVSLARLEDGLDEDDARLLHQIGVEAPPSEPVDPQECVREIRLIPLRARMAQIQRDLEGARGGQEELLAEKLQISRMMTSL
jgi:DNA primase